MYIQYIEVQFCEKAMDGFLISLNFLVLDTYYEHRSFQFINPHNVGLGLDVIECFSFQRR